MSRLFYKLFFANDSSNKTRELLFISLSPWIESTSDVSVKGSLRLTSFGLDRKILLVLRKELGDGERVGDLFSSGKRVILSCL